MKTLRKNVSFLRRAGLLKERVSCFCCFRASSDSCLVLRVVFVASSRLTSPQVSSAERNHSSAHMLFIRTVLYFNITPLNLKHMLFFTKNQKKEMTLH